jgi:hypothetical protein
MATIELDAKHNPMAWLFYLTKLRVAVDGQPQRLPWGNQSIQVPPGAHTVEVSFGYMGKQRGTAQTTVTADETRPARLRYRMPSWMFAKGRLTEE